MPATRSLKTDWKRIGRSGPTTDGREIKPEMLLDAAETYDKDKYTALVWPEHLRTINYGLVEELRAEKTKDGVDLFALISPNKFYLETNSIGQRLFLSMELMGNFAKSGKHYLTGLAATDDPASLGTAEMRFSAEEKKAGVIRSNHEEITFTAESTTKDDEAEALSIFRRLSALFSKSKHEEDEDMADKAALEKFQTELETLKAEFAKLKPAETKYEGDGNPEDAITKLSKQVEELTAKVLVLTQPGGGETTAAGVAAEIVTKLTKQVTDLETKLSAALQEQPGTAGGEHAGGEGDAAKFADIY